MNSIATNTVAELGSSSAGLRLSTAATENAAPGALNPEGSSSGRWSQVKALRNCVNQPSRWMEGRVHCLVQTHHTNAAQLHDTRCAHARCVHYQVCAPFIIILHNCCTSGKHYHGHTWACSSTQTRNVCNQSMHTFTAIACRKGAC